MVNSILRPAVNSPYSMLCFRRVVWLSNEDASHGYAIDYVNIVVHAVSRDPEISTQACIYAQLDTSHIEVNDEDGNDDPIEPELRLIPSLQTEGECWRASYP